VYRLPLQSERRQARRRVKVTLVGFDHAVQLSVRDLGEGFDAFEVRGRRLGLVGMDERTRSLAES